jgi:hypothetical protein
MPGFDGTGPAGMGPMTGGRRGWCNPVNAPYAGYHPYRATYPVPASPIYTYRFAHPRWGLGRRIWGPSRSLGRGGGWRPGRGRAWWWR